jgi:hypothetical protein
MSISLIPMKELMTRTTEAEWMREREITARFGLSHTLLFNLRRAGEIESVSLRLEGKNYGARLFNVQSVRAFLARQSEKGRAAQ